MKVPKQITVWSYRRWRWRVLQLLSRHVVAGLHEGDLIRLWTEDYSPTAAAEEIIREKGLTVKSY